MMTDASITFESLAEQISKQSLNLQNLTRDDLIGLIQSGISRYPEFVILVSTAVLTADNRVPVESPTPPSAGFSTPAVVYKYLRINFDRTLHAVVRLRPTQHYERVGKLISELDELVATVAASVNENSPDQTVEDAFRCLQFFSSRVDDADQEIRKGFTGDWRCTMNKISKAMVGLAKLLREKGGPLDAEIEENLAFWGDSDIYEEFSFPEVLEILKGLREDVEAEPDENDGEEEGEDEEEEEEEAEDEVDR